MPTELTHYPAARICRQDASGRHEHPVMDPGSGRVIAYTGWSGQDEVNAAVQGAKAGQTEWAGTPAPVRAKALQAIAAKLRSSSHRLAPLIARETGKRITEAIGEVEFSAKYFDWFAAAAVSVDGEQRTTNERRFLVNRRPVGIVAALCTWNFPLSIPARKVAAALAAGCPVILKPSELSPTSGYELVRLADSELPVGVLGYIVGDGEELSNALIDHPDIASVSFTGSTAVGRKIGARAANNFTRATLELGGRAPFIVRHDADVRAAVATLMIAKFRNNGESCIAANNVVVHASLYDQFLDELILQVEAMRVGDQFDESTDLGPMISAAAAGRLRTLVAQAKSDGRRTWSSQCDRDVDTYFPATIVETQSDDELWQQEIFGPVCAIRSFSDEDKIVTEFNSWGVGLAGYVCGTDSAEATKLAERLRIGIVGVNNGAPNTPEVPFGGFGESGIGREGGMSGLFEFTEEQTVSIAH